MQYLLRSRGGWLAAAALVAAMAALRAGADPLSKKIDLDFYSQVDSRDLRGLATRSDGRLVAGPALTDLAGPAPAELLWCLQPAGDGRWLVGTGPEGRIVEVTVDPAKGALESREFARLDDVQVFALRRLPDGEVLAGTSPRGWLYLLKAGRVRARVGLPVGSVLDFLALGPADALAATGNPGRVYRIDLAKFGASGLGPEALSDPAALALRGVTLFAQIRDRNVRRLARLSDGRIVAGSAPNGNVYLLPAPDRASTPGPEVPFLLQKNRDAEVTDLLPLADGGFLVATVFSDEDGEARRESNSSKPKEGSELPPPAKLEKFGGRSTLTRFSAEGYPEVLAARFGLAFYRLARVGSTILIAGGERGDLIGYDLDARLALTFAGSSSARLNDLAPVPGSPERILALRNNAPGLAWIDFQGTAPRSASTRVLDLGAPARLGALRIDGLREVAAAGVGAEAQTSYGDDLAEGWSPWTALRSTGDGWRGPALWGRYVRLRLTLSPACSPSAELSRAALYYLPQDRPPRLRDFRLLPPNWAIVAAPEQPPPAVSTLGQLMQPKDEDKRRSALLSSQVVASPGTQAAYWEVEDPDGDNVVCTFSIRRDGDPAWTDLAVDTRESFVQFDTSHLPDGVYLTRLTARETGPRPASERLCVNFETDSLVVDHTPPEILEASVQRAGDRILVRVRGRDALSLLDSIEVAFNNGAHEVVDEPADGIRDGREKTFVLEEPAARAAGATALEVTLYDASGNGATRRLPMPP